MAKAKEQEVEIEDTLDDEKDLLVKMLSHLQDERWSFYNARHANYHALVDKIRSFLENEVKERLK